MLVGFVSFPIASIASGNLRANLPLFTAPNLSPKIVQFVSWIGHWGESMELGKHLVRASVAANLQQYVDACSLALILSHPFKLPKLSNWGCQFLNLSCEMNRKFIWHTSDQSVGPVYGPLLDGLGMSIFKWSWVNSLVGINFFWFLTDTQYT